MKEKDLIQLVEKNGVTSFKTEGLTIDQLRDIVLGGPNNFEIMRPATTEDDENVEKGKKICSNVNVKKYYYPKLRLYSKVA